MAKRVDQQLAKRVEGLDPQVLAKLVEQDTSLAGMDEYRILPRFKVIQSQTADELIKKFGTGTAIIRPGDAKVWKENDRPFLFVPQFFYAEFAFWSDRRDTENRAVLERTFDPTSELAKNSRDEKKRFVVYEGHESKSPDKQWKKRYVEHLRFPGLIYGDHELSGTPAVLSFERGEFVQGKNFISAVKLRKQKVELEPGQPKYFPIPLYAQVWAFSTSLRDRNSNKWFGFDFHIPTDVDPEWPNVIRTEELQDFQNEFDSFKKAHAADRLRVDGDESDDAEPTEAESAGADAKY